VDGLNIKLFRRFDRHEPHGRPGSGLADCLRVIGVVFVRLDERFHKLRRDELWLMPQRFDASCPKMGSGTGLHDNEAGGQQTQERQKFISLQRLAHDCLAGLVHGVKLDDILCQIQPDHSNFFHGPAFVCARVHMHGS